MKFKSADITKLNGLFFVVLMVGIVVRFLVAALGHNFDFDSWRIVAGLVEQGKNVYANTDRYPYAPGWFLILHFLDLLAGHNETIFRVWVVGLLTSGDVGIFLILWFRFGKLAACWFLLNPISIIISGFQNNFDNMAVLLGLMAVLLMGNDFEQPVHRKKLLGLFVLGLSLVVKHVFFAFPFWLAVKQKGLSQKLIIILIPVLMFGLSFVPYWHGGGQGIIQNVFMFRSLTNEFFYRMFLPQFMQFMFDSQTIWLFLLILFAFIYRKKNTVEFLLLYTCVMVATAPANSNEYLAIPTAFAATHLNLLTVLYTVAGSVHLLVTVNGPFGSPPFYVKGFGAAYLPSTTHFHLTNFFGWVFNDIAIYFLCLALIWVTWRQNIISMFKKAREWFVHEIKNQLGPNHDSSRK